MAGENHLSDDEIMAVATLEALGRLAMEYKQVVCDSPMEESELESIGEDGWLITGPPTAWGGRWTGELIYLFQKPKLKIDDAEIQQLDKEPPSAK